MPNPIVNPNASQPAAPNPSHPRLYTVNSPTSVLTGLPVYPSPPAPNPTPPSSRCRPHRLLRLSKPPPAKADLQKYVLVSEFNDVNISIGLEIPKKQDAFKKQKQDYGSPRKG